MSSNSEQQPTAADAAAGKNEEGAPLLNANAPSYPIPEDPYMQAMMRQQYEAAMASQGYPAPQSQPQQQQQQGGMPYPYGYNPSAAGPGGMPFFMPPPPGGAYGGYPPQQQQQQQYQQQYQDPGYSYGAPPSVPARPPLASARRQGNRTPTNVASKTFDGSWNEEDAAQESRRSSGGANFATDGGGGGSGLPPLADIFTNNDNSQQPLLQATGGTGYGAVGSDGIWSAPRGAGGSSKLVPPKKGTPKPVFVRTNSSGDMKAGRPSRSHRRSSSDTPLRAFGNPGGMLPPMAGARSATANRLRTLSAGGRGHRRGNSMSSITSMMSASAASVRSNIVKSSLFAGVTESGKIQLHFPYECVRLMMTDAPNDRDLEEGKLYIEVKEDDVERYERYHQVAENMENGQINKWELDDGSDNPKSTDILPVPSYVLAVRDDVYKRIFSEIADARGMPCGLFFCGHHEDVSHPSISIAVVAVAILFTVLALVAYYT